MVTAILFAALVAIHRRALKVYGSQRRIVGVARVISHQLVVLFSAIAGAATIAGVAGGLYWIAPAALWGIVVGVADGWVLLIEIRRWGPSPSSGP